MSDKAYVGRNAASISTALPLNPFTKVLLLADTEHYYEAGDDTGRALEAECPWADQAMVDYTLSRVKGYEYRPFEAKDALLDLAAEIGDGVSVGGTYTVLGKVVQAYDKQCAADLSAPWSEELPEELPSRSRQARATAREIAKAKAEITVTTDQIKLDIQGVDGRVTTLTQTLDSFETRVQDAEGAASEVEQKVDSIALSVTNGEKSSVIKLMIDGVAVSSKTIKFTGDVVFESDLEEGNTTISGACISTGKILAQFIKLGGEMAVYESLDEDASIGGYLGFVDLGGGYVDAPGLGMYSDSTYPGYCVVSDSVGVLGHGAAKIQINEWSGIKLMASDITCGGTLYSYDGSVITSDRRKKREIKYDGKDRMLAVFDRLKPSAFQLESGTSGRTHYGFVAQDIQDTLKELGIDTKEFAGLVIDKNGNMGLRYIEFIPLLVAKVQDQQSQIDDLRKKLERLEAKMNG